MRTASLVLILLLFVTSGSRGQATDPEALQLQPTFYALDVDLDYDSERLSGTARITLHNTSAHAATEIPLILYRLLNVDAIRDLEGRDLPFKQQVVAFTDFPKQQVNHAIVPLDRPVLPGDSITIDVDYSGHILGYAETGMRYIRDHIAPEFTIIRDDGFAYPKPWYPSYGTVTRTAFPSFHYEARITVPDTLVVANGGTLVERTSGGDRVTYAYRSILPSWRMDFAVAAYGEMHNGPVRVFYLPDDSLGAAGVARGAQASLDLFTSWFGPLQDERTLTFIQIPDGWGSQADATAIIQTAAAFRDSTRREEVYHEISHLWNVQSTDRPAPRWEEGLAMFLQRLASQEIDGHRSIDVEANALIRRLQRDATSNSRRAQVPMIRYGAEGMTDASYVVGALFFDLMYRLAGSEAFNRIIAAYYGQYLRTGGNTDDLRRLAAEISSRDLEPLFSDWVSTTMWVNRVQKIDSIEELVAIYE